jgi:2,4-dienoyl-CoA reductase-like NADH-dependent reductase (Old Yellow Enzyme family)
MLIRTVEKFLRETRMPATKFGRLAVRDPRFVFDLRLGREPRRRTKSRVEHFMNTYWEAINAG